MVTRPETLVTQGVEGKIGHGGGFVEICATSGANLSAVNSRLRQGKLLLKRD